MKQLVSVNLTTRTAKNWAPPEYFFGETVTLALRFFKNSDGKEIESDLTIDSIKASIGVVDARPAGGKFALKIGPGAASESNTTDLMDSTVLASDLAAAINDVPAAATYGVARVVSVNGSWFIFFGTQGEQVPMEVVNNGLWPVSFGRINARQKDGKWRHTLRLVQAPVAFTTSHDIVLPPAPVVTRIQEGGSDGTFQWNEIQQLYVPPEFRGAYILKKGYGKTPLLSRDETTDSIQTALAALGDGFSVTLPLSQKPAIEFVGDYAGMAHDLLVVEVKQAPAGDLTFSLDLDRDELAVALLGQEQVTLPLEISVVGTDEGGFTGELVALTLPVVIRRPVSFPELEERPVIDWLRPYSPKTYVPFGANQTLTGNKYYTEVVGDGDASVFVVTTGLAGELIYVFVRENVSGGRLLVHGTDFSVEIDSDNEVTVTALLTPPDENGWVVTAVSAQTIAEWANDLTVTVPQVIAGGGYPSLPDFMDNVLERVDALEEKFGTVGVPASTAATTGRVTLLRKVAEVMFYRGEEAAFGDEGVILSVLPRNAPLLLPAVHDASTDTLPIPLPVAADNAGKVYQNETGGDVIVPTGGGIRGYSTVRDDEFVGCDGVTLFRVNRDGVTNSYFPAAYERTLFTVAVNEQMMAVNRTLEVLFGVQMQLIAAPCSAQWMLIVDLGTVEGETSPDPVGVNLEKIQWATTPVLEQRIIITEQLDAHFFGIRIKRTVEDMLLDKVIYGVTTGDNDAAPASANFVLRARLAKFDTENSASRQRGWLFYQLFGSLTTDESGKQTIKPAQAVIS